MTATVSKKVLWFGWLISLAPAALLVTSAWMKFARPPMLVEGLAHLGYPDDLAIVLGILELTCTAIYLIPQTAILGAVLLTGYLGGATATHVRVGDPFITPIILGVVVWAALFIREPRLRGIFPLRKVS